MGKGRHKLRILPLGNGGCSDWRGREGEGKGGLGLWSTCLNDRPDSSLRPNFSGPGGPTRLVGDP